MIRLLTAGILIPIFYLYVTRLPVIYFRALGLLLVGIGLFELFSMTSLRRPLRYAAMVAGAIHFWWITEPGYSTFQPIVILAALLFLVRLFVHRSPEGSVRDVGIMATGLVYVSGLLSYQVLLREQGPEYIVLLYAVVWSCDGLALYAGRFLGRHKLYPSMSPNKTVEGALGGLAGGVLAAGVVNYLFGISGYGQILFLGGAAALVGQAGDLIESMLKRDAGVKDSSAIFPGHGGALDKIDASLFAGPVLYLGLLWFQP